MKHENSRRKHIDKSYKLLGFFSLTSHYDAFSTAFGLLFKKLNEVKL